MIPKVTFKSNVKVKEVDPRILSAMAVAAHVWFEMAGIVNFVVTSVNDSAHRAGSYHYSGRAFDGRTHNLPNGREREVCDALQERLGGEFRVLLEAVGTPNEHVHCELRPGV